MRPALVEAKYRDNEPLGKVINPAVYIAILYQDDLTSARYVFSRSKDVIGRSIMFNYYAFLNLLRFQSIS
jgi:hypothetical protein